MYMHRSKPTQTAAQNSDRPPHPLPAFAFTSAPCTSSTATTSACPLRAAAWSGVHLRWNAHRQTGQRAVGACKSVCVCVVCAHTSDRQLCVCLVCMYICNQTHPHRHMYIDIHIKSIHTNAPTNTYVRACECARARARVCVCMYVCISMYVCRYTYVYVYIFIYVHTYLHPIDIYVRSRTDASMDARGKIWMHCLLPGTFGTCAGIAQDTGTRGAYPSTSFALTAARPAGSASSRCSRRV